ncbi:MAG: hypothetical protein ABIJ43_05325 [Candidatus Beckwithbacteria bacterium]|nr:hypothetical protein [Patescibacteria group bacterium]
MTKLQITLTNQEALLLGYGASNLGYSLTRFVKFVLGQKAVECDHEVPTFKMSKKTEKNVEEAMNDYKAGRTVSVDIDKLGEYFENDKKN